MSDDEQSAGSGTIEVLSVGAGDMRFTFNKHDSDEVEKAQEMIRTLIRQGYAVLVQMPDNTYQRVTEFDAETDSYVIGERVVEQDEQGKTKVSTRLRKLPRATTKATAVARSAGG